MVDLGRKRKDAMYPSLVDEKNIIDYPHLTLPSSVFGKQPDVGSEIELKVKVKVTGIFKDKRRDEVEMEVKEGEVAKAKETEKEE